MSVFASDRRGQLASGFHLEYTLEKHFLWGDLILEG
jgi:hypothetical protein